MRPAPDYHGFYGQRGTVRRLSAEVEGAKTLGEPCPHILLGGGSGLGKTHLARSLAAHYATTLHYIPCSRQITLIRMGREAQKWDAHDFAFLDEAHTLPPDRQEALYRVIDAHMAPKVVENDKGRARVDGEVKVPPVTVIVATDRIGDLRRALVKRLSVLEILHPYSDREMAFIIRSRATELGMLLSTQAPGVLAKICQGTPRLARFRLESLRRFYAGTDVEKYTRTHVRRYLSAQGVDAHLRTPEQQLYMQLLARFGSKTVSLRTISSALQLDQRHVELEIENRLVLKTWVEITSGGRRLTEAGRMIVGYSREEADDA